VRFDEAELLQNMQRVMLARVSKQFTVSLSTIAPFGEESMRNSGVSPAVVMYISRSSVC